jgi:tRNA nucleotidyltransferase (CCA-adding enzyme)
LSNVGLKHLKKEVNNFVSLIKKEILKRKIEVEVFVGGSYAKGTLIKNGKYDIDVFLRFDPIINDISRITEEIVMGVSKYGYKVRKVRGSRDYFTMEKEDTRFEVIPVLRIKNVKEGKNVTDLSYFHVNYVKNRIRKKNLAMEIMLAKKFCKAQRVYGAESYISGFSGYGLECLIIHYGSFEKMLKELIKVDETIVLDPEKLYKKKQDVLLELNENKLQSPIILVDPTWKERNSLAALNWESFRRFQNAAKKLLKNPSREFFRTAKLNIEKMKEFAKKNKSEFLEIEIETNRQEGDIAGTKMKKFSRLLKREIEKYFYIVRDEFDYNMGKKSRFYLVISPKKQVIKPGPPVSMKENVKKFKRKNKNVFEKDGLIYSRINVNFSGRKLLKRFLRDNKDKVRKMGIVRVVV